MRTSGKNDEVSLRLALHKFEDRNDRTGYDEMRVWYGFLYFSIIPVIILLQKPIAQKTGWWGIVTTILIVLLAQGYLQRKRYEHKISGLDAKFPSLRKLENGERVTVELKNGDLFSDFVFVEYSEQEVTIIRKMTAEQIMAGEGKAQSISLRKVKTINSTCQ